MTIIVIIDSPLGVRVSSANGCVAVAADGALASLVATSTPGSSWVTWIRKQNQFNRPRRTVCRAIYLSGKVPTRVNTFDQSTTFAEQAKREAVELVEQRAQRTLFINLATTTIQQIAESSHASASLAFVNFVRERERERENRKVWIDYNSIFFEQVFLAYESQRWCVTVLRVSCFKKLSQ